MSPKQKSRKRSISPRHRPIFDNMEDVSDAAAEFSLRLAALRERRTRNRETVEELKRIVHGVGKLERVVVARHTTPSVVARHNPSVAGTNRPGTSPRVTVEALLAALRASAAELKKGNVKELKRRLQAMHDLRLEANRESRRKNDRRNVTRRSPKKPKK